MLAWMSGDLHPGVLYQVYATLDDAAEYVRRSAKIQGQAFPDVSEFYSSSVKGL